MADQSEIKALDEPENREQTGKPRRAGAQMGAHLYVMQSASGLIKIGRSGDPLKRLAGLQTSSGHSIKLVAVFELQGDREIDIHHTLSSFRKNGEWFGNTKAARAAIASAVGRKMRFPYPSDEDRPGVDKSRRQRNADDAVAKAVADIHREAANKAAISARLQRRRTAISASSP